MSLITSGRYYDHAVALVNDITQGLLSKESMSKEKDDAATTAPPEDIVLKNGTRLSDYDLD